MLSPHKFALRALLVAVLTIISTSYIFAQSQNYTNEAVDYSFELPSPVWREVGRPDGARGYTEFVYGDRLDGYLRVRKETVDTGMTSRGCALRDQDQKLRFIPNFVSGKEEPFVGRFNGSVASYEFTQGGKPMTGRIYYLQADSRTIYTLHFTGSRDKLSRIRNQTDNIARSFNRK